MSATSNFEAAIEYFDDFVLILLPTCVQIMFNKCLSQNHFSQLGKHKTISVLKSEDALGLTITDNGAGYAFVKRIKVNSVASNHNDLMIGDHIASIDEVSVVGYRHYEVAKMLKEKKRGSTITLSLYEPIKLGFVNIAKSSRQHGKSRKSEMSGKETLRLKSDGKAAIEIDDERTTTLIQKVNELLEAFIGIHDLELAQHLLEISQHSQSVQDLASAINESDLEMFLFPEDFVMKLFNIIR